MFKFPHIIIWGQRKENLCSTKAVFLTTEQNKTSISLDWRKFLRVIYLLRIRLLKTFFKKWQNQASFYVHWNHTILLWPWYSAQLTALLLGLSPKGKKKVRCTWGWGGGQVVGSSRPLDKGEWGPGLQKIVWASVWSKNKGELAPQAPPLDPQLACIMLSTSFVVQASSILCVMAELGHEGRELYCW